MTDAPRFAFDAHALALVARDLRDGRAAGDPKMVADGRITQVDADDRLRIADALAAEWTAYDEMRLPADDTASAAEKLALLTHSLAASAGRRDKAHAAMLAEAAWLGGLPRGALWQLVDAHVPQTGRIEPYLHWESYAAAIGAMLWWHHRTGIDAKRWAIETTIAARAMVTAEPARVAA